MALFGAKNILFWSEMYGMYLRVMFGIALFLLHRLVCILLPYGIALWFGILCYLYCMLLHLSVRLPGCVSQDDDYQNNGHKPWRYLIFPSGGAETGKKETLNEGCGFGKQNVILVYYIKAKCKSKSKISVVIHKMPGFMNGISLMEKVNTISQSIGYNFSRTNSNYRP